MYFLIITFNLISLNIFEFMAAKNSLLMVKNRYRQVRKRGLTNKKIRNSCEGLIKLALKLILT